MVSLLLVVIYIAFISLGLPDSLLGSAWPVMQAEIAVPVSYAGIITMIIAAGTVVSSLFSDALTSKIGAGRVTAISVLITAGALFGFSFSSKFWMLCVFAIPYGLGAGAVDAALNNYVALHFKSRHMNWLHCFWGVGASISPFIMSYFLTGNLDWSGGYRAVAVIQIILSAILFISLPLWKNKQKESEKKEKGAPLKFKSILNIKGIKFVIIAFFGYCALEHTTGLWASSYLVISRGINAETAAGYASLFYLGITAGRFLSGFVSNKIGNRNMIRIGLAAVFLGIAAIGIPIQANWLCLTGLIVAGFGCAPIYPAIIHATPENFGAENSQAVIGVQMASAYSGSAFMPPLFGLIANHISINIYPAFLLFFALILISMTELLNKTVRKNNGIQKLREP